MSLIESIGAIFDKLLAVRTAAVAALASFVLLLVAGALVYLQIRAQLGHFPDLNDRQFFTTLSSAVHPTLATTVAALFIIFVIGACSLTVGLLIGSVRLFKESLVRLLERFHRDLRVLERLEKRKSADEKDEELNDLITVEKAVYPYLIILFDLIFYGCLGAVILIVALSILVVSIIPPEREKDTPTFLVAFLIILILGMGGFYVYVDPHGIRSRLRKRRRLHALRQARRKRRQQIGVSR